MAGFDSGVSRYVTGTATVTVHFPVDSKGREHIACVHCKFFSSSSRFCQLSKEIPEFPDKFVGSFCPLEIPDQIIEPKGFEAFD